MIDLRWVERGVRLVRLSRVRVGVLGKRVRRCQGVRWQRFGAGTTGKVRGGEWGIARGGALRPTDIYIYIYVLTRFASSALLPFLGGGFPY